MRWFALAVFVWLLAFLACLGALLMSPQEDEVGEIAVEHSAYCDQFVVKTKQGYVTLIDTTGNLVAIAGARQISGSTHVALDLTFSITKMKTFQGKRHGERAGQDYYRQSRSR